MNRTKLAALVITAIGCALVYGGDASARGGGGSGQGAQLRDGSAVKTKTQTSVQTKTQAKTQTQTKAQVKTQTKDQTKTKAMKGQNLQDGTGAVSPQGVGTAGQGQMRRLGPGDGTGNTVPPKDGTGFGSPASK